MKARSVAFTAEDREMGCFQARIVADGASTEVPQMNRVPKLKAVVRRQTPFL